MPHEEAEPPETPALCWYIPEAQGSGGMKLGKPLLRFPTALVLDPTPNKKKQVKYLGLGSIAVGGSRVGGARPCTPGSTARARGHQQLCHAARPRIPTQGQTRGFLFRDSPSISDPEVGSVSLHFTDEETESERGGMACPRSRGSE